MQTKWCPGCQADRPIEVFYSVRTTSDGLSDHCAYHNRLNSTKSRDKRRIAFITEAGGKCVQCGFDDWRALQVDHVNGGGSAERKEMKSTTKAFYAKVLANPDDYQLLCANCNVIKRREAKEARGALSVVRKIPERRLGYERSPGKPRAGQPVGYKRLKAV